MYFNVFLLLVSFLMICMGVIFLIIEISTHITEFFKWNMYKGKTEGTVFSVKKSELTASRRLVEEKIGEHDYLPEIPSLQLSIERLENIVCFQLLV